MVKNTENSVTEIKKPIPHSYKILIGFINTGKIPIFNGGKIAIHHQTTFLNAMRFKSLTSLTNVLTKINSRINT